MPRLCLIASLVLMAASPVSAQQARPLNDLPAPSDQWSAMKISPPELISGDRAEYPVEGRFQLIDALCLVSLVVSAHGEPQAVRIVHCTDSAFEDGSSDAVKQYRFKPATTAEGNPVPVSLSTVLQYHAVKYSLSLRMLINLPAIPDKHLAIDRRMSKADVGREMSKPIRYGFIPLEGGISAPDRDGIYSLTRSVTGPRVIKFADEGYGPMAFAHEGNSTCDIVLTISTKGKADDPHITRCERPELEKPVVESLLKSQYKPGMVRAKEVPMRATIHLNYGDDRAAPPSR